MPEKNFLKRMVALSLLIVLILLTGVAAASAEMLKIAVASDGQTAAAAVGREAARSSFFLVFDGEGKFVEAISNPHRKARSGASSLVVDFLKEQGVHVFISQAFGEKMVDALKAKGITHFQAKGSAEDVVNKYLNSVGSKKP